MDTFNKGKTLRCNLTLSNDTQHNNGEFNHGFRVSTIKVNTYKFHTNKTVSSVILCRGVNSGTANMYTEILSWLSVNQISRNSDTTLEGFYLNL